MFFKLDLSKSALRTLYLIDFGLARLYQKGGQHLPEKYPGRNNLGTDVYQSKFLMDKTNRATRRDDLISAMYSVLHYYLPLPWLEESIVNVDEKLSSREQYGTYFSVKEVTH